MVYAMWTPGDKRPAEPPASYEYFDTDLNEWKHGTTFVKIGHFIRRWPADPQEQRPTAFGLLSTEEQEELEEARDAGKKFQYLGDAGGWCNTETPLVNKGWIYRIKPEPSYDFAVTMNGKPVNPKDISKETWDNLRGEQA